MKRNNFFILAIILCVFASGCKSKPYINITQNKNDKSIVKETKPEENASKIDISEIEQTYVDSYTHTSDNFLTVKQIVKNLGESGYIAIDSENKVNMTCADKLQEFINKQKTSEPASVQVIQVSYNNGFSLYHMTTNESIVNVKQTYYKFANNHLVESKKSEFEADYFTFTEEGYLMIEGFWHSPEKYVLSLSAEEEHIALRVFPLEEKYRELCNKYISPVSYGLNNMFLTDWNHKDFSKLDFYDIFEKFYMETYETSFPYIMNEDLSIGEEYEIPANEFEKVVMQHIQITKQELHSLLRYSKEMDCYIFRPRGFYEYDYADIPYPEVVSYKKNEDGSITLLVNAVYPNENTSKLFSHMVTIKENNGKTYYLSNQIVENQEPNLWWHADCYTEEEWHEYYGDGDN